jgi:hypothetical protein
VTVETPFPQRPATPFWDPRGPMGMAGFGDTAVDVLNAVTAGAGAAERSLIYGQAYPGAGCPIGTVLNYQSGTCQPGGTVTASASSGVWILVAIGVALFFMSRGGR